MNFPMAKILGVEGKDTARKVPGTVGVEGREVRYLSDPRTGPFDELFSKLVRQVQPPRMKRGGAMVDGCEIELPDGRIFQAVTYKGDLDGWREQVSEGARMLGLVTAQVQGESIVPAEGPSHLLANCRVRFY
jgi:hypothetical protein